MISHTKKECASRANMIGQDKPPMIEAKVVVAMQPRNGECVGGGDGVLQFAAGSIVTTTTFHCANHHCNYVQV